MAKHRAKRPLRLAACGLVLLGLSGPSCTSLPRLTVGATQRLRSRADGSFAASAWTVGAGIGWRPGRMQPADADERGAAPEHALPFEGEAPPCAFEALCGWERAARSEALLRAESALLEEHRP